MSKRQNVHLNIYDEDLYSDYGIEGEERMNDELIDIVETSANTTSIRTQLTVHFLIAEGLTVDDKRMRTAYKNSVIDRLNSKNHEIARCGLTGLIFLVIAIAIVAGYVWLIPYFNVFWQQFYEIIEWVFVWTAVEILTIQLIQLFIDKLKIKKLVNARVYIKRK